MNKQDIIKQLNNSRLDAHERERLNQLLHYMTVEGITRTSSNKGNITNGSRANSTRTAQAYKQTKNRTRSKP